MNGHHIGNHATFDEDGNIEYEWLSMASDHIKIYQELREEEHWEYVEGI